MFVWLPYDTLVTLVSPFLVVAESSLWLFHANGKQQQQHFNYVSASASWCMPSVNAHYLPRTSAICKTLDTWKFYILWQTHYSCLLESGVTWSVNQWRSHCVFDVQIGLNVAFTSLSWVWSVCKKNQMHDKTKRRTKLNKNQVSFTQWHVPYHFYTHSHRCIDESQSGFSQGHFVTIKGLGSDPSAFQMVEDLLHPLNPSCP